MEQKRVQLGFESPLEAPVSGEANSFEILAITAGEGNGWHFSARALRASLALWESAECFVDYAWQGHSLRDLVGVCFAPAWDETAQGIRLRIRPGGPSAALLSGLGQMMLAPEGVKPRVGFSADILFTANGREVERIEKVFSLDLVTRPARGGQFLRALNQLAEANPLYAGFIRSFDDGGNTMEENQQLQENQPGEAEKARALRQEMCRLLLEQSLTASRLPLPAAEQVRKNFAGRLFEPAELQSAIDDSRQLVSDLTGGLVVHGPGRVAGMFSAEDQFSAAVHDLLGAARPEGLQNLKTAQLSGIRELYTRMTGDCDFSGGYDGQRAQFSAAANLPGILKNALNRLVVEQWAVMGEAGYRWWEPVVDVQHFSSLHEITGVLVGEITVLPSVAENAAYTELPVSDSAETASFTKYGGYIGLSMEMFERDQTNKLRQYPKKLATAALRRISGLVAGIFSANAGIGPAMADSYNVFEVAHHANLLTAALSSGAWEAASAAIYNQPMVVGSGGTAPVQALEARYCLVPRALQLTARSLLYPVWDSAADKHTENMQKGQFGDVITVPEWTDATNWAAAADPRLAPAIILAERFGLMPEIFIANNELNGALFSNDEVRIKVRHFCSVFVADYRPLHKSNVAG